MLVYLAKEKTTVAIDYREAAPADTPRDVFLNATGEADAAKSRDTGLAVGVPGTVAGLSLALRNYGSGKFSLAELVAPAVALARSGIDVEDDLADSLPHAQARLKRWPVDAQIFLRADGAPLARGDALFNPTLPPSSRRSAAMARAPFMMVRSRQKSLPASAPPAAG